MENHLQIPARDAPENMSSYDLISHPGTLRGGMTIFKKLVTTKNQITSEFDSKEFEPSQSVCDEDSQNTFQSFCDEDSQCTFQNVCDKNSQSTPDPSSGDSQNDSIKGRLRSSSRKKNSNITCTSEDRPPPLKRQKRNKVSKVRNSDEENTIDESQGTDAFSVHGIEQTNQLDEISEDQQENDDDCLSQVLSLPEDQYQAQFGELMKRFDTPQGNKKRNDQDEDFDLSNRRQLMRTVFTDYDEKERLCDLHSTRIKDLQTVQLKQQFLNFVDEMCDIFEGKVTSSRMQLYCSNEKNDRQRLRKLVVADPFSNLHSMMLASELMELLVPKRKNRMKYTDFIKLVMLPELLIRIYSSVNGICYDQAEKEMKWGPRYDGPIDQAVLRSQSGNSSSNACAN